MPRQDAGGGTDGMGLRHDAAKNGDTLQDYPASSTKCLYLIALAAAVAASVSRVSGNLKESGEFVFADNTWREVLWDDSVECIVIQPRTNSMRVKLTMTTAERTSPPDIATSNLGIPVAAGSQLVIKVAGRPKGSIFIANGTAGSNSRFDYICYGEKGLLNGIDQLA